MTAKKGFPPWVSKLNFEKLNGLLPAIIIDEKTNEVLMLGFMSKETFNMTVDTGYVHYWSRTRQKVWKKGETSGHTQRVISITPDCDFDTLLIRVHQKGVTCHTGEPTCFFHEPWRPKSH
ncbi:MAG: phosphoribosyl-AMP cyclohydrolase [Candidatus Ranarchaeia archaeon]